MTDIDSTDIDTSGAGHGSMPRSGAADRRSPRLAELDSFVRYMGTQWETPERTAPVEPGAAQAAARHRARLSEQFAGRTLVIAAGRAPVRSNDTNYDFRPDSDFFWLTGCGGTENALLIMQATATGHDSRVFIPAPAYPGERGFFADAAHGELWVGVAPGPTEWSAALEVPVSTLDEVDTALSGVRDPLVAGRPDRAFLARHGIGRSPELGRTLAELRMIKDEWEIGQLRSAVDHTVGGFAEVARAVPAAIEGLGERWLQGTFDRHARTFGNAPGYATIVGSGPHAPTLHWVRTDGPVLEGETLLLDMGVEERTYYTADVTRTLPASGRFTDVQRSVHDLVEKSHRAGLAAVRPGRDFLDFHDAAMEVIARGLRDWGVLPVSVDEALSSTGQQHRRYLVCGIGHHLGLDVHDCAQSDYHADQGATLAPGMVMTVEPGLYFHANDLSVPPELRGIGVRIEDDVLLTATGSEVLSAALPIEASALEQWMARAQGDEPRNNRVQGSAAGSQ